MKNFVALAVTLALLVLAVTQLKPPKVVKETIEVPVIKEVVKEVVKEVEKPVYVDKPFYVVKYVNKPVYIDRVVYRDVVREVTL